jgi:hypothetical protein
MQLTRYYPKEIPVSNSIAFPMPSLQQHRSQVSAIQRPCRIPGIPRSSRPSINNPHAGIERNGTPFRAAPASPPAPQSAFPNPRSAISAPAFKRAAVSLFEPAFGSEAQARREPQSRRPCLRGCTLSRYSFRCIGPKRNRRQPRFVIQIRLVRIIRPAIPHRCWMLHAR